MNVPRQCCRPGCSRIAVATLTFVYAESTAVIGPLSAADEPHSWDLCSQHADRITVPVGWEMLRSESRFQQPAEDHELTAIAEAVREAAVGTNAPRAGFLANADLDEVARGRHRAQPHPGSAPTVTPRPGRRGHLRVLPDPVD
ncbi:DUF3499 domain-containing protein [Gordonia hydrophobica]|uniref:DUF3499 domain-containing protein n=1 Tax=Gordonia hydrophobica TaxID=40516 RepID=A0ABZ2U4G5_9ACTN|nr:DUF3499 domain-containing protein [Gordonia hydrophobica]